MGRKRKPNPVGNIALSKAARDQLRGMMSNINVYMQGARQSLNVPDSWIPVRDPQGFPVAFGPPPAPKQAPKKEKKE